MDALDALNKQGIDKQIKIFEVPGAFEIPFTINKIQDLKLILIIIALGAIIKGETVLSLHSILLQEVMQITQNSEIPIILEY